MRKPSRSCRRRSSRNSGRPRFRSPACGRIARAGVKLAREDLATPGGTKFLIHNYGHSGAGITLSWGCANVVQGHVDDILKDMARSHTRPSVAVLGAGVIGLTVASELRRKWRALPITVYAPNVDARGIVDVTKTTSYVAGGQIEPSQIYGEYEQNPGVLKDYVARSIKRIREIEFSGQRIAYGVAQRKNYTLPRGTDAFDDFMVGVYEEGPIKLIPPFETGTLPFAKFNKVGREYSTWLMNPKILLPRLVAELRETVPFRRKTLADLDAVKALRENIIINCTGYGAKKLFDDHDVHGRRGNLTLLKNTGEFWYFFSGGCGPDGSVVSYMFARQTDIVVGGTVVPVDHDDAGEITRRDNAISSRLIDNIEKVFDGSPDDCQDMDDLVASRSGLSLDPAGRWPD